MLILFGVQTVVATHSHINIFFYFLVAQKISQLVNDNQADGIVQELCMNLHREREANILIFLVYHNGTEKQMEDLLFASMLPFEDYKPITLDRDDPFI